MSNAINLANLSRTVKDIKEAVVAHQEGRCTDWEMVYKVIAASKPTEIAEILANLTEELESQYTN